MGCLIDRCYSGVRLDMQCVVFCDVPFCFVGEVEEGGGK